MRDPTTRRSFLRNTAAAAGYLVTRGLSEATEPGPLPNRATDPSRNTVTAPLVVVTESISRDVNPRASTWSYITEILRRAGLFFSKRRVRAWHRCFNTPTRCAASGRSAADVRGPCEFSRPWSNEVVRSSASAGHRDGTKGFGVSGKRPLAEGWMKVTAPDHRVTVRAAAVLCMCLADYAVNASSATSLAEVESGEQGTNGSAILENRCGERPGDSIGPRPDFLRSCTSSRACPCCRMGRPAAGWISAAWTTAS